MIGVAFTDLHPPTTSLQHQLGKAALLVQTQISNYEANCPLNPGLKKPFCLQFPTCLSFIKHSVSLEGKCEVLPKDSMVILIDKGGICFGVGLPPKPQPLQYIHQPQDVRARSSLDTFVNRGVLDASKGQVLQANNNPSQAVNPETSPLPPLVSRPSRRGVHSGMISQLGARHDDDTPPHNAAGHHTTPTVTGTVSGTLSRRRQVAPSQDDSGHGSIEWRALATPQSWGRQVTRSHDGSSHEGFD
ncbi:hypothetical protein KEM48_003195 [Puccinia striiformis f. sp. tritici PST-130]|uniref:Uncharacterized protein n=1 Tax=Puccinia striiformis f. sp. tritici PST-78 TaxID=1165861 RepID=A0A0L0VUV9_9BASI|nr:hypothetical protein KEM48_003195 [Puccinia striiformis f. sp. tritici PST-130]KNF03084.1 hypothetical protein PSTG_03670 [Puccinia striiformis f. sp. tritici PST-78]